MPGWPVAIEGHRRPAHAPLPVGDGTVRIVCDAGMPSRSTQMGASWTAGPSSSDDRHHHGPRGGQAGPMWSSDPSRNEETGDQISHDAVVDGRWRRMARPAAARRSGSPIDAVSGNWSDRAGWRRLRRGEAAGGRRSNLGHRLGGQRRGVGVERGRRRRRLGPGLRGATARSIVAFGSDIRRATRVSVMSRAEGVTTSGAIPLRDRGELRTDHRRLHGVGDPATPLGRASNGTTFLHSELENVDLLARPVNGDADRLAVRAGHFPHDRRGRGSRPSTRQGTARLAVPPAASPDGTLAPRPSQAPNSTGRRQPRRGRCGMAGSAPVGRSASSDRARSSGPVAVGEDGTAYGLAIEPESGGKSSGTILAIAPDSTVL